MFEENPAFDPVRRPIARFADMDDIARAEAIARDPDYGEIVCRCGQVSRAEILQAVHNPLGVRTLAGVKLRTRAMMGRCQGGYCQMRIARMIEEELGVPARDVTYSRTGSWLFCGALGESGVEA